MSVVFMNFTHMNSSLDMKNRVLKHLMAVMVLAVFGSSSVIAQGVIKNNSWEVISNEGVSRAPKKVFCNYGEGQMLVDSQYIEPFDQARGLDYYKDLDPSIVKDSMSVCTKSGNAYTVKALRFVGWDADPGDFNVVEIYKDGTKIYDMICIMGWLYFPSRHTKSSTLRCCYAVNMRDDTIALVFHGIYISSENPQIAIVVLKEDKATLVFNRTSDINEIKTSDGVTTFILQENVQEYDINGKPITDAIIDTLSVSKDGIYFYEHR